MVWNYSCSYPQRSCLIEGFQAKKLHYQVQAPSNSGITQCLRLRSPTLPCLYFLLFVILETNCSAVDHFFMAFQLVIAKRLLHLEENGVPWLISQTGLQVTSCRSRAQPLALQPWKLVTLSLPSFFLSTGHTLLMALYSTSLCWDKQTWFKN